MKSLLLFLFLGAATSCTTLENRRDLYRSPAEGYERWHRRPPPPGEKSGKTATTTRTTERNGVMTFPEEPGLPEGR